ncbi:TetR/AcrR family transcriptional regulator [Pseudonocardia acidicola]|uniref:Helix-turn-helix transcriptional regulator n=1 Tax=Pseudonocardia acidicola TaxID=2724939 RepID=A0ABX1SBW5_9PSEU|nr:TetR family transcriptional regulator [Pseudonocardia acidicola]NMH97678.1 helix-turn-helix transcriptional regulator [Pseudonocardia acidicola]
MARPADGQDTRSRLLTAAETLFAERGSEAVSLREIGRAAGARNVIAAQYWFSDREGLIGALLDRHRAEIETRRHALLDAYEAAGRDDVHALAGALVRPLAAKLDQGGSGAGYLRTLADLLTRPEPTVAPLRVEEPGDSMARWRTLLEPLLEPAAVDLHRRFHTLRFVVVELAHRAQAPGRTDHRLFVSQLVDAATGLLSAAVSEETRRLQAQRRAVR